MKQTTLIKGVIVSFLIIFFSLFVTMLEILVAQRLFNIPPDLFIFYSFFIMLWINIIILSKLKVVLYG